MKQRACIIIATYMAFVTGMSLYELSKAAAQSSGFRPDAATLETSRANTRLGILKQCLKDDIKDAGLAAFCSCIAEYTADLPVDEYIRVYNNQRELAAVKSVPDLVYQEKIANSCAKTVKEVFSGK